MEWGHSSWGMSLPCSPLHQLRIKAIFLFPPNSVSIFFIQLQWAEKAKILGGNKLRWGAAGLDPRPLGDNSKDMDIILKAVGATRIILLTT